MNPLPFTSHLTLNRQDAGILVNILRNFQEMSFLNGVCVFFPRALLFSNTHEVSDRKCGDMELEGPHLLLCAF